jgi:GNAT superfamily N-acetyltransferase
LQSIITFSEMLGAKAVMSDIKLSEESETLYIMTSGKMPAVCNNRMKAEFTENYRTVFEILKSGFSLSDCQFDEWYADTCHRVRHGISRLIVMHYGSEPVATATVLFDDDKSCFLSHIAVRRDMQKNGIGTALLSCTANLLDNRKITLICKENVQRFYINCGFTVAGTAYEIARG